MNKTKVKTTVIGLIISMVCIGAPVNAEEKGNRVSYSPEDWPTRWSSAIHQQKTAKFPTRTDTQAALTELPEAVSDQDLFYSPQLGRRMRQDSRPNTHYQPYSKQHFARNGNQAGRDSARAYLANNRLPNNRQMNIRQSQGYYGNSPYRYQNASSQTVMDPVLGHPSLVVPMSPRFPMNMWPFGFMSFGSAPYLGNPYAGSPYGAVPYGGYGVSPYGYPMNSIGWGPQVGPW